VFPYSQFFDVKRVSVAAADLDAAVTLVRALPCTDWRCPNAATTGVRRALCDRCMALDKLEKMDRRDI